MFTGIIEATARIWERTEEGVTVERPALFDDIKMGSSVCVVGVCLSVVAFDGATMRFDVIPETWSRTKLGSLKEGDVVNLERAMPANGRFDGNIVQGHVEGTGTMVEWREANVLALRLPADLLRFAVPKGAITLDGVALTVVDVQGDVCTVALIPHTLAHTTLDALRPGDVINIETDVLARYVQALPR